MNSPKKQAWKPWHGFAIEIGPDTDLRGEGLLVAEYLGGGYEPIASVSTINEAQELAAGRIDAIKAECKRSRADEKPILAAVTFKVWARGVNGAFLVVPIAIDGVRK